MEGTTVFFRALDAIIVTQPMVQHPKTNLSDHPSAIEFSQRDREDAARLLATITGIGSDTSLVAVAREILRDRRRRWTIFNRGMFGEAAWEILLTLYILDEGPRLTIGRLSQLAESPMTTTLRWLDYLADQGLVVRQEHPRDSRTAFISLTNKAREAMAEYLSKAPVPRF